MALNKHQAPVAVITGAAQGIGRQTAEHLAGLGYRLALLDTQNCHSFAAQLNTEAVDFTGDVTDEDHVTRTAHLLGQRWGRVDVLVNNAGISSIQPAEQTTTAAFRKVLEVNLLAPFLLARVFGSIMLKQGAGSIVNVASIAGLVGIGDRAAYNASKHGLIGLTRTLAAEWGARGVRSNAVCPGWVKTEMDTADQGSGNYTDEDITGRSPMARFATPADIAKAIAFLADPNQSGYVNGHALVVDGGWTTDGSWQSLRLRHR